MSTLSPLFPHANTLLRPHSLLLDVSDEDNEDTEYKNIEGGHFLTQQISKWPCELRHPSMKLTTVLDVEICSNTQTKPNKISGTGTCLQSGLWNQGSCGAVRVRSALAARNRKLLSKTSNLKLASFEDL